MSDADYLELPLGRFLDLVASGEPAPGGGAAAAVCVALAAGLTGMAARHALDYLDGAAGLAERTEDLRHRTSRLARADAAAYRRVIAAGRDDGRRREALSGAADVPLAVAEAGAEVSSLAARLAREGNPNLEGDAICALLLGDAGVRAATALVKINLPAAGVEDARLSRANELVETVGSACRSVEGAG
jgi:methenyltetrahydrofolate cyclohydrolase